MKPVEILKDIFWVGTVDWERRNFHGYSTSPRGTTYNSFLLKDEKVTLFDTVPQADASKLLCNIAQVVEPEKIDYIVVNHVEMDHSGALPRIVERVKPEKIFCSKMGLRALKAHFDCESWPIEAVESGGSLNIGKRNLTFVEARMLHWPDSMLTYIAEDKTLICNDAFGQNWATSERFADQVDRSELYRQLVRYYANIVLPYSPIVEKTIATIGAMGLDIDYILPDHGLLLRGEDVAWVIEKYQEFAAQKPAMKAVLTYDTMWKSTEKMAHAIADGLVEEGLTVRIMDLKANDHTDIMEELLEAGVVCVGSPTHNNGILPKVADMLTYMKGLKPQNKIGCAFGSYGWSGESVKVINESLEQMGMELPCAPVKALYVPKHEVLAQCVELGRSLGQAVKAKIG
jgi:flavorubredoxin